MVSGYFFESAFLESWVGGVWVVLVIEKSQTQRMVIY